MGGRNGLTLAQFLELSDRQLVALLSIEFDDDGRLVTEGDRLGGRSRRRGEEEDAGPGGAIDRKGFPSQEELRIPDAALALNLRAGVPYAFAFWHTWRRRQAAGVKITDEEIMERWKVHVDPYRAPEVNDRLSWPASQQVAPGQWKVKR